MFPIANESFLLSELPIANDAMISRVMAYLSKLNTLYVSTPREADISPIAQIV